MKKIAVFIGKSLLAQGILSCFQQHPENCVEVCSLDVFDLKQTLDKLIAFNPDIIIIESQYFLLDPLLAQASILKLFPELIVLELHVDSPAVQIIRWEQHQLSSFEELISALGISNETLITTPAQQV